MEVSAHVVTSDELILMMVFKWQVVEERQVLALFLRYSRQAGTSIDDP